MEEILIEATKLRPKGERTIAAPLVAIDLPSLIKQITSEKSWKKNEKNSITVFNSNGICKVLIALSKGAEIKKHTTVGLVSVQILKGEIKFKTNDKTIKLRKGHLLELSGGISHSLQAKKTTIFLLTIITAAGERQSNHNNNTTMEQDKLNGMSVIRETV